MRMRFLLLGLVGVALGACTVPARGAGHPPAATAATAAAATSSVRPRPLPAGLTPAARRRPAPALQVTAFDGRTITVLGYLGRPVVVSFFESWCPICNAEQPDLSRVTGEFAGRVAAVGVSYHDTVAAGRAYQRRYAVGYPLANDRSGRTWARWGVPYQPVLVLVDKRGRVAARFDGGTTAATLRADLAYLLGE